MANKMIVVDRGKVMEIKLGNSKIRRQTGGQGDTTFRVRVEDQRPIIKDTIEEAAGFFCQGVPAELLDKRDISADQLVRLFSLEAPSIPVIRQIMPGFYVTFPYKPKRRRRRV